MTIFEIKRNDTKPYLATTLQDANGSAIDLNNTAVHFNLGTNDNQFTSILSGACVITGSTAGQVEYRWVSGTSAGIDTNRSGLYLGEFEVTYSDSSILTLPSDHSLFVKINEDYD